MSRTIDHKLVIQDILTDEDILITCTSDIYSKISTSGTIYVREDCEGITFYDDVHCGSFVVLSACDIKFRNFVCDSLLIDSQEYGSITVNGWFSVTRSIDLGVFDLNFQKLLYRGKEIFDILEIEPIENNDPEINQNQKEETSLVAVSNQVEVFGLCELCRQEKPVQTMHGSNSSRVSFCFDCAVSLVKVENNSDYHRVPTDWEVAHMSDEEKDFFAQHHYVTFPQRLPTEPFIRVQQESENGEITYKEVYICDPEYRYLTEDDIESYRTKVTYNGGPYAWLLQGTFSASSLYALMALAPTVGPVVAALGWAASCTVTWKWSKKLTNLINEKIVLPHEMQARRDLIENRRRDEKARENMYIETV